MLQTQSGPLTRDFWIGGLLFVNDRRERRFFAQLSRTPQNSSERPLLFVSFLNGIFSSHFVSVVDEVWTMERVDGGQCDQMLRAKKSPNLGWKLPKSWQTIWATR